MCANQKSFKQQIILNKWTYVRSASTISNHLKQAKPWENQHLKYARPCINITGINFGGNWRPSGPMNAPPFILSSCSVSPTFRASHIEKLKNWIITSYSRSFRPQAIVVHRKQCSHYSPNLSGGATMEPFRSRDNCKQNLLVSIKFLA